MIIVNFGGYVKVFDLIIIYLINIPVKVKNECLYKFKLYVFNFHFHQILHNSLRVYKNPNSRFEMTYPLNFVYLQTENAFPNRVKTTRRFRKHLLGGLSMEKR